MMPGSIPPDVNPGGQKLQLAHHQIPGVSRVDLEVYQPKLHRPGCARRLAVSHPLHVQLFTIVCLVYENRKV